MSRTATKIKVLHLIKSLGRGGAEMLLPETLKFHNKEAFQFYYAYFLPWKHQMVEVLKNGGGNVTCFEASNNIQLLLKVRMIVRFLKSNKIQIIHAHLPWAGIVARLVHLLTGIPVIYSEHNKQERYHFATRWVNLATFNWQTHVIAVSDDVAQSIRKYKPGLRPFLQVILNGVNVESFSPQITSGVEVRRQLGIPENAFVIGTVAVFRFQKRLDVWLELANGISDKISETHFIIVGDGPLKQQLLNKQGELKIKNKIHFVGLQSDVRPYLAAFDLYMMCSIFEGLPVALLEAMAMACPIITTDAGGIKEIIRPNIDGLMCNVNEPSELVNYAVDLFHDPLRRKAIGLQGSKRIMESFSINKMVEQLEAVYRLTLNKIANGN